MLFSIFPELNHIEFTGVCIDSRKVQPGNLFVAIRGDNFDGDAFINDAVKNGATAVICHQKAPGLSIPQCVVPDTIAALAELAHSHRKKLSCEVIALTGSNGKTSVKEMIASILPKPSFATPGNLNNHIGVPLSVLQLTDEHRYAVFELGANHIGEIAYTVAIVEPKVTLINNIAPAHIGEFGSLDGVANAKGEIYEGLAANGTAIINADDAYSHFWDNILAHKKTLRFSIKETKDCYAQDIQLNDMGCAQFILNINQEHVLVQLQVPGLHNVSNALAAASATHALGISISEIAKGLQAFGGVSGRMSFKRGLNNSVVIDDTYNANLRSSLSALEVLSKRAGRRIFVFGDMGELGPWSEQHHQEVGAAAKEFGIDMLMTLGTQSALSAQAYGDRAQHYQTLDALVADLVLQMDAHTTILVKGSRSSRMEKIVQQVVTP